MKSKYKLKIKEISMRLKNGSVLLLSIFCLFALASAVQAEPWTDPTCAAPDCNTDGPVWVNPEDPQDSNAASLFPMINIADSRSSGIPAATAYVESNLTGRPAIHGLSIGSGVTAYGGYFDATYAPGLKVMDGIVISSLADDPTYNEAGLLYLNSGTYANQFRYYSGGWRILNPIISTDSDVDVDTDNDADGIHELYYSVAAGNQRGVAIKNSADADLTPNDAYTLDVVRKSQSTSDRTVNGYLEAVGDTTYANGALGAYDGSGNMVGVKGSASGTGAVTNYGGYFTAAGNTGVGVYGESSETGSYRSYGGYFLSGSDKGSAVYGYASSTGPDTHYGGDFEAAGANGVGVRSSVSGSSAIAVRGSASATGVATNYGGWFFAGGNSGVGIYAAGPSTPTSTAYAAKFDNGAILMEEVTPVPGSIPADYGALYVKYEADSKIYFKNENGTEYDLTAGGDASGNIADGSDTGQMTYWNQTAAEWQPIGALDMFWDNTNKNLGVGIKPISSGDNKLHVVKSASSGSPVAVYADTTLSGVGGTGYGAYLTATHSGTGGNIYGTYSTATGNGSVFGGRFSATGGAINTGVSGSGSTYGGSFSASESDGMGVYAYASNAVNGYGGYFTSDGESTTGSAGARALGVSKGVWGSATGADGTTAYGGYFTSSCSGNDCVGVYGQTASAVDAGVEGVATANGAADNGYGGYFTTASGVGSGVRGIASYSTAGTTNYGGYFSAAGETGRGAYGVASGNSGVGVYGDATATGAVSNYGGIFLAAGNSGRGVYGSAAATGAVTNYGGWFSSAGDTGRAVYGNASASGAVINYGGYFTAAGTSGVGVYGSSATGLVANGSTEAARFTGAEVVISDGSDAIGYATGAGDLYVGDALEVDGLGYFGENVYIGQADDTDADYLYFDAAAEYISFDAVTDLRFEFSDGIYASGATEAARFAGSEVVITDGSDAIGYATGAGDLYVGDALEVDGISYLDDVNSSSQFLAYASDTVSAPGYSWGGDTNTGLFHSAADTLNFTTAGTERMEISSTGLVGINTAPTTGYTLHVETSSATSTYGAIRGESTSASYGVYGISVSGNALQGISSTGRGVRGEATSTTAVTNYGGSFLASGTTGIGVFGEASAGSYGGYFQNTSGPAAGFNRQTDDGVVVNIRQAGTTEGTITVSGTTVSYTAFTGSHYAWPSQEIDRGYLVSFNNDNKYLNGNEKSEVIYGVDITTKANSKDVLGSYLSIQTPKEKLSVENPALVMAVGNGDMWVADNGSNLEVGDYLISSDVPGHAMKVTDEYPVAYVVARVAENVDWSKVEEKTEDGIKHKKISVLFESFILNQDLGLAFDKNQNLDDLSWFYAMEAKTPVEKAIQNQKQQLDALETKVERMESEGCANTDAELMEYIKQLEARIEALEAEKAEPVKTSFWSKLW